MFERPQPDAESIATAQEIDVAMGRVKRKTEVVQCRLNEDEAEHLRAFADANGVSVSEVLRRLTREIVGFGPTFDTGSREAILHLTREMRAIGTNLNQIARAMNGGLVPSDEVARQTTRDMTKILLNLEANYISLCAKYKSAALEKAGRANA